MTTYNTHKHYDLARRAHYWTSFSPEKRAESECAYFDEIQAEFAGLFGDDSEGFNRTMGKFESLFTALLHAKSRCASSMITGPAGFNTRRAEKANNAEHNKSVALTEFVEKVRKSFSRTESTAISSDDPDCIEKLQAKIAAAKESQEIMKATNAAIRKLFKAGNATPEALYTIIRPLFKSDEAAMKVSTEMLKKDCFGGYGFARFELTNNLANIKRMEQRIALLQRRPKESQEETINGVRILQNIAENRTQIYFEGIPPVETRAALKRVGFKWSPRNKAWQRFLSSDALAYARNIVNTGNPYQTA